MDDHNRNVSTEKLNESNLDILQVGDLVKLKAESVNAVAQLNRIFP